ncbi:MAG: hypothetical protein KAW93_04075, partial [Methanogenium sp.]|nr:hypothetical protein [Methanogenium sp.]
MKSTTKIMVVAIAVLMAVFMIVAPAAAGYNLDRLEVSPSGDLSPGDQVTVECDITLTASSGLTFIANHDLEAYTELEDPEWEYQKEVNGHGIWGVSGKKYLTFGGWDLSYPDSNTIEIHYRLAGEVPEVSTTSEKTIFRLRETDVNGNVITNGETLVERTVLKGSVTIAGSGDGQYYMGEEVTLSGTNTYSGIVYLYITGPYVVSADGVKLDDITTTCITGSAATFVQECVRTDNTWEYTWDTANSGLDAGTYTIYAAARPNKKNDLTGVPYDTVSVVIRQPFITATTSAQTVAKGDGFYITGTADGNPDTLALAIWVLGNNYYQRVTKSVEDDGSFSHEISSAVTANMTSGQYFIVVQHPMYNGQLDIIPNVVETHTFVRNIITGTNLFVITGTGSLQGSDAACALVQAINSPDIDDISDKLAVFIEEPWIQISPVGNKYVGDTFSITGTTNLA